MDNDRYNKVVMPHHAFLARFAHTLEKDPEERKDLVQETLCVAAEKLDTLTKDKAVKGWLRTIMYHVAVDGMRQLRYVSLDDALAADESEGFIADVSTESEDLWQAIAVLSSRGDRLCMGLHAMGCTAKEISMLMGQTQDAIAKRTQRATLKLREILK